MIENRELIEFNRINDIIWMLLIGTKTIEVEILFHLILLKFFVILRTQIFAIDLNCN